jgi:hypothetical protein
MVGHLAIKLFEWSAIGTFKRHSYNICLVYTDLGWALAGVLIKSWCCLDTAHAIRLEMNIYLKHSQTAGCAYFED